jgi:hypothetical protein
LAALPNALARLLPALEENRRQSLQQQQRSRNASISTTFCSSGLLLSEDVGATTTGAGSTILEVKRGGYRDEKNNSSSSSSTIAVEASVIHETLQRQKQKQPLQQKQQRQQKQDANDQKDQPNKKTRDKQQRQQELAQQDEPSYVFSVFQKGDGHETDPDRIPVRYLNMHHGNRLLAKESLAATIRWREEQTIDTLLQRPHELYDICKTVFPHYFAGRDTEQHVVFVQRPGMLSMDLAKANHLSKEELLRTFPTLSVFVCPVTTIETSQIYTRLVFFLDSICFWHHNNRTLRVRE